MTSFDQTVLGEELMTTMAHQARVELLAGGVAGLPVADRQAFARALPALLVALEAEEGR
ncbi:MAG TPA: hypothetical protein VN327_03215 [Pseudonocardiaceae bacterium]|nr:hypothetical protein [Pseudonocardiaceae bacterium]